MREKKQGINIAVVSALCLLLALVTMIYGIGGRIGPWAWNAAVFVIAPIAVVLSVFLLIRLLFLALKKKRMKAHLYLLVILLALSYPMTILFGVSALTYPTRKSDGPGITLKVPVAGENIIFKGGKDYASHAIWPSECYAYDLLAVPYDLSSTQLEDYGIYGREVLAPAEGRVIGKYDGEEDIQPHTEDFKSGLGNYIFIKLKETGTYLILAHLKKGSIKIQTGDEVKTGEVIAAVGNSGTTSEPHLHVQHQVDNPLETKISICTQGLPIYFKEKPERID